MSCSETDAVVRAAVDSGAPWPESEEGLPEPIAGHLRGCASCRDAVRAAASVRHWVAQPVADRDHDAQLERLERTLDAAAGVAGRAAEGTSLHGPREVLERLGRSTRWLWGGGLAATAAAAVLLVVQLSPDDSMRRVPTLVAADELRARSGSTSAASRVHLQVYSVAEGESLHAAKPRPLSAKASLGVRDHWLFSYTNATSGPSAYRWLAVVARDGGGRVHWLLPSRPPTGDGAAEAAIAIEVGVMGRDIPKAVRPTELEPGSLELYAIFSQKVLSREQLHAVLWQGPAAAPDGALVKSMSVTVTKRSSAQGGDAAP